MLKIDKTIIGKNSDVVMKEKDIKTISDLCDYVDSCGGTICSGIGGCSRCMRIDDFPEVAPEGKDFVCNECLEKEQMPKKQPFCWKCASKITEQHDNKSSTLIGCTECKDIHSYTDATFMCPLMKDAPKKVIISVVDGEVSVEKSDNIEVEVRVYTSDVENYDQCKQDKDGDWYKEMLFPAEKRGSVEFIEPD